MRTLKLSQNEPELQGSFKKTENNAFSHFCIVGINPYFFPRIGMNKEVDNTELSHVGVGHTDS